MNKKKLIGISVVVFSIILIITSIENLIFGFFIVAQLILPALIGIITLFGFKRKNKKMSTVEKVQFDEANLKIKKVKDSLKALIISMAVIYVVVMLVFDIVYYANSLDTYTTGGILNSHTVAKVVDRYDTYGFESFILLSELAFYCVTIVSYIGFMCYIKHSKKIDDKEREILVKYYRGYTIRTIISLLYSFGVGTMLEFVMFATVDKPIIYLYPEKEEKVKVKFKDKKLLTHTYPKYNDEWNVIASPDGTLIDENNKKYYALYYEAKYNLKIDKNTGFCIKGQETAQFLEEKLEMLGLNYKEKEEFIVYWLPKLEENKYNYIYFMINQEVNDTMELEITPKPDTLIRVWMVYKPLNKEIEVKPQQLTEAKRNGFTVVEWGGSKI